MDVPLLTTKLHAPRPRFNLVPRPHLIQRLDEGLHQGHRLTLVSAAAGFGKTTLLTEWLSGTDYPHAWLSLDSEDNDSARFLTYLLAALQSIEPNTGQAAQAMLQSPQPPPPEALLASLINDVAAVPDPFIIVLDDYHLVHTLSIHQQLAFLLEHHPPQMYLVIATREDPPIPLARLRARGQMTDIRQADLEFTEDETAGFLRHAMQLELPPADIAALHQRTEGWIAGLQLAALSLRGRDDAHHFVESFTGSDRYILDFLIEEVFQQQADDVQGFLLKTSVLDRFTPPLCDAVAGRDDSRGMLLALEQANLFIVPLDESREWYRYHRLFADLLRHWLHRTEPPDSVAQLHRQASHWYEAEGFAADAVHHALAGSDWERAATIILSGGETMLKRGEVTTLLGWLQALPENLVRARPQLCYEYSWPLILTGQLDTAEFYLGHAEQVAQEDASLLGDVLAAQAYIARARGDDARTIELSHRALSLLPPDALAERSVVAVNLGIAHWNSGHLTEAEQALTEADHAAQQSGNIYARLTALSFLGVLQGAWGRLHQAVELFRQAIRLGEESPAMALAHNELGALLYEWNDLDAAADHLQRGIELSQRSGHVEVQIGGYRRLARLKQAQGDAPAALDALQKADRLARDSDAAPLMRARNAACHVQIALAQDDLATATRWAERVTQDADASAFFPLLGLTPARLHLARNEKAPAAEEFAGWYETATREGWRFGLIEVRVLQALAAPTSAAALAFLADALAMAQPEGYIRTFVDKGEPLAELLGEAASQGIATEYVAKLLAAFDAETREREYAGYAAVASAPAPLPSVGEEPPRPPTQSLVEPLSERELQVLQLLAGGRTYHEIAQALYVSINTVKTHLKSIYGKLSVHNRREATARAKGLGLVA